MYKKEMKTSKWKYLFVGGIALLIPVFLIIILILSLNSIFDYKTTKKIDNVTKKIECELEEYYRISFNNDLDILDGEFEKNTFQEKYFIIFESNNEKIEEMLLDGKWKSGEKLTADEVYVHNEKKYSIEKDYYTLNYEKGSYSYDATIFGFHENGKVKYMFVGSKTLILQR